MLGETLDEGGPLGASKMLTYFPTPNSFFVSTGAFESRRNISSPPTSIPLHDSTKASETRHSAAHIRPTRRDARTYAVPLPL